MSIYRMTRDYAYARLGFGSARKFALVLSPTDLALCLFELFLDARLLSLE